jgi:hypothetical protein
MGLPLWKHSQDCQTAKDNFDNLLLRDWRLPVPFLLPWNEARRFGDKA